MSENKEICFVIMPFSKTSEKHTEKYWTDNFETFLKPLIEENPRIKAQRSDVLRGDILKKIVTDLVVSRIVVADLTDHNSNVYWELGVRQSFKHGTITIVEEGTKLPFDIGGKGTLFYQDDHLKNAEFCKRFKMAIEDCLAHPERPDSYVLETLSGRGTLFELFHRDEAIRRLDAVLSECNKNSSLLNATTKQAEYNQKNPRKIKVITSRFAVSAVQLLITDRYIDESKSFFEMADKYLSKIVSINDQLNMWEHSLEDTNKWLLLENKIAVKLVNEFQKQVVIAREKLTNQF